jgi:predicted Zn-dependent protease
LVKLVTGMSKDPGVILAHVKAEKNLFTRHHIDQELQADSCGARLLGRVLPDAQALADSLNAFLRDLPPPEPVEPRPVAHSQADKLAETFTDVVDTPMRRHPTSEERSRNLKAIYNEVLKDKAAGR